MKIALIAALNNERVIGKDGDQPWKISDDLKRFKNLTSGHTVVMGRRTYQAIGRPLPNRRNVVLTSHPIEGVETYSSVEALLDAIRQEDTVFVIGGGLLYEEFLPLADILYLTLVNQRVEDADTFFPAYEHLIGTVFRLRSEEKHDGYTFLNFVRESGENGQD